MNEIGLGHTYSSARPFRSDRSTIAKYTMTALISLAAVIIFVVSTSMAGPLIRGVQDETLWNELRAKSALLYQQGRYSEAVEVAKEALKVAEETFGTDHPNVATVLKNMAELYKSIGKKEEAERLEERAKGIRSEND